MEEPQAHIADLERTLAQAHKNLDVGAIARLLHPDYINLHANGSRESRAEFLSSLESGERVWRTARSDDLDVKVIGNCAVVTGRWRGAGTNHGQRFDYAARFLSVWVLEERTWRNIAYSAHEIAID